MNSKSLLFLFGLLISLDSSASRCSEQEKAQHFFQENVFFQQSWEQCGLKAWGRVEVATQCLSESQENLSELCASCFGEQVRCVAKKCWFHCAFSQGAACDQCAENKCHDELASCAGTTRERIPKRQS